MSVYLPIRDWAGIGRRHWMIERPPNDGPETRKFGVGRTLAEAIRDFRR